jgi:hypothetical protein
MRPFFLYSICNIYPVSNALMLSIVDLKDGS